MGKRWLLRTVAALALLSIPAWADVSSAGGEGCARLAELEPLELVVRLPDGRTVKAGTGFWDPGSDRVLAPVRRLITPLAPGPLGVFWDDATRTAAMLREGEVLSIHMPEGRDWTDAAVLNGEVVGVEAVLCQRRLYASLGLLAGGLGLRHRRLDARTILVESR